MATCRSPTGLFDLVLYKNDLIDLMEGVLLVRSVICDCVFLLTSAQGNYYVIMTPCTRALFCAMLCALLSCSNVVFGATVHLVFKRTVSELEPIANDIVVNLTSSLYQAACLQRYSVLNHSNMYFPNTPPVPIIEIGTIRLDATDGAVSAVLSGYSMMSFTLDSNATAALLMYLSNVDMGTGGLIPTMNPIRALGVVGGQWNRPQSVAVDDTLSVVFTVSLAVVVFLVFSSASIISSRRRLIQESRGINFNDLIRLETELYEDADRRLMQL
jgi:hypothetical protein